MVGACTPPGHQATELFRLEMNTNEDRLNVLLVEDDDRAPTLLRRAFESFRIVKHLIRIPDGEQARAYLRGREPFANREECRFAEMLVVDHRVPGLDGLELLKWVRRQGKYDRLPVVVCGEFEADEEAAVNRLNAVCFARSNELSAMQRAIGEAMVGAFRTASLVPEFAWYRSMSPRSNSRSCGTVALTENSRSHPSRCYSQFT